MIARGAVKPISISAVPAIITLIIGVFLWTPSYYIAVLFILLLIAVFIFFRDPDRKVGRGVVSPADGKVILVNNDGNRIDVFMNITDVHVNRSPYSGEVKNTKRVNGKFKPAFSDKSENNFRYEILLQTNYGPIKIYQITGFLARRIVPYINKGDELQKGDKIGLIRFGSRVRLDLPENVNIIAEEGDKVRAGESTIGVWDED